MSSERRIRRLAFRFGRWNRRRKAAVAISIVEKTHSRSLLLVGVAAEPGIVNNLLEQTVASKVDFTVATGLGTPTDGQWPHYVLANGLRLPFASKSFDMVVSNAVIEHVGDATAQQLFMSEIDRVGRSWLVTTPNRWFPVEAHYHTLFSHWLPGWGPRGTVTRLLGRHSLASISRGASIRGLPMLSPTLMAIKVAAAGSTDLVRHQARRESTKLGKSTSQEHG